MKKLELFELRKGSELKFDNPRELISKIENIMRDSQFPLVYGYREFSSKGNWKLTYLKPKENSDELTVKNFLEGIKEVDKKAHSKNFSGKIDYPGLETMHYSNEGQTFLDIYVDERNNSSRTYCLEITLEKDGTYGAKAINYTSNFEKFMEKHLGPNSNII
jgi:hypothetical protein